ncbi:hypothetical protein DUNSADRAFT_11545 [Dunaliella salina]|uniref:Uncharacterized protein n=1 Tax=Dunaliella salina TaxID=3046 RepID=A0ABQ7GD68_DUNSA|nr:hypothetical protein DUNSADRAFT_11545 [Dunaliella salina]|eukprot:KAF5832551.1 hypothetical protein DUNSADRAFT_11545 [Dunaliella salina]
MSETGIPAIPGTLHGRDNPSAQARDARILARRKRIQDRLASLREGDVIGGKEGEKKEEIGKGKQQLVDSRRRLYRVKLRTDQDASAVRVAGDERETAHRAMEEMARQFMSRQFVEMQNAYKDELDEIENAFLAERDNTLLSGNKIEIEKLFKTRYEREDQHLNRCDKFMLLAKDLNVLHF